MTRFKGKTWNLPRLRHCPVCGSVALLRKDSTKRFQVWCSCGCKTGWSTKTQAVIDWYNLAEAIDRKRGENG